MQGNLKYHLNLWSLFLIILTLPAISGMGPITLFPGGTLHFPPWLAGIFTTQHDSITIQTVLHQARKYHSRQITITGVVTQPELHLDESKMYIDFVFRLEQGIHSLIVFGRHDRTQGTLPISLHQSVQVVGIFWETLERKGARLTHVLEAQSLLPYPSLIPDNT